MYPFREKKPKHRIRKECKHYKSYTKTLREDFNKRCGYCNALDINRIRNYAIDHFVPQNPKGWVNSISPNRYDNLIYSCSFCNGAKDNKWPTKNERIFNNGRIGFIKPTTTHYGKLFKRDKDGFIILNMNTKLAQYIHRELNFELMLHSLNWKIEKFESQEIELKKLLKQNISAGLKEEIKEIQVLRLEVFDYRNKLIND
jgi:5-methylcytosine-specific restriction endonuclease McrA